MKRVIKVSKAWIAAFAFGVLLAGCGGGGSGSDSTSDRAGPVGPVMERPVAEPTLSGQAGSAVLSWSAPDKRVNGEHIEELYDLKKYIISYGQNDENLDHEEIVFNENLPEMSHKISGLGVGTWYFSVSVEDADGLRSAPSDTVQKTFES